jgi:hypothetical protein
MLRYKYTARLKMSDDDSGYGSSGSEYGSDYDDFGSDYSSSEGEQETPESIEQEISHFYDEPDSDYDSDDVLTRRRKRGGYSSESDEESEEEDVAEAADETEPADDAEDEAPTREVEYEDITKQSSAQAHAVEEIYVVPPEQHRSPSILSKAEQTHVINMRAVSIAEGGPCFAPASEIKDVYDSTQLALLELLCGKCPILFRRFTGVVYHAGKYLQAYEYINPNQCKLAYRE